MDTRLKFALLLAAVAAAGCQSQQQIMDQSQPQAVAVATRRAQFEMNCPEAKGEMLSREQVQPVIMNPRWGGYPRLEYTVGVAGCGQRSTYLVICPEDGGGCVAAGTRNTIR